MAHEIATFVGLEVPSAGDARIGRCDLAVDVSFTAPSNAQAVLRALAALNLSHLKRTVHHARDSAAVQTVEWKAAKDTALRIYERGEQELGIDGPGGVIRIERQDRPLSARRVSADAYRAQDLAAVFAWPLRQWSEERVVIAGPEQAYFVIKHRTGKPVLPGRQVLTRRRAERLMGTAMALLFEGDAAWPNRRTAASRKRELRAVGIQVDPEANDVLDLGSLFDAVRAVWTASVPTVQTAPMLEQAS
jgi:hypothetical protein